jgi:hypothetical protein
MSAKRGLSSREEGLLCFYTRRKICFLPAFLPTRSQLAQIRNSKLEIRNKSKNLDPTENAQNPKQVCLEL